jgi:2-dehydro-3-deoxyphosphooctonate aldolase (KDO 8-P synthase)
MKAVQAGGVQVGGDGPLVLIAGPCVIESADMCIETAERIAETAADLEMPFVFKASFDKANRTSPGSFRGPGLEAGLDILNTVREKCSVPVTCDIHLPEQAEPAARVLDIIQIPAFLCRQTDLLLAAAETGKPVNVKKGQFLSPGETEGILAKLSSPQSGGILLTERGTFFGYNRLVNDFTGLVQMRALGIPVVFDATHSVQKPGGQGTSSGGNSEYAGDLARAAAAVGIDALFLETHPDPDSALSDGPNMIPLSGLSALLTPVIRIDQIRKAL